MLTFTPFQTNEHKSSMKIQQKSITGIHLKQHLR